MTLSNEQFYLPYQFVPVTGKCNGQPVSTAACADIARGNLPEDSFAAGARHDLWLKGHRSGRILCRLTTETPTFVGGERLMRQSKDDSQSIRHVLDANGKPMIPGNSLRGVVGSIAEVLSQSSMRVLADATITLRVPDGRDTKKIQVPGRIGNALAPHLRPYTPDRASLSPVECLFGVVRDDSDTNAQQSLQTLPALASRVRFSDAVLISTGELYLSKQALPLQVLSSPNPKCTVFYFSGEGCLPKVSLDLNKVPPRGQKVYLHHPKAQIDSQYFVSRDASGKRDNLRVRVEPLKRGIAFEFHVDYDNLSAAELHLLLTSLRPRDDFRHRIGMGKPLGLGTVRIDLLAVLEVDRHQRYSGALDAPRYATVSSGAGLGAPTLPRYQLPSGRPTAEFAQGQCEHWLGNAPSLIDQQSLDTLCTLLAMRDGEPVHQEADVPVCYPRTPPQMSAWLNKQTDAVGEDELFKWNNSNEKSANQQQFLQTPGANRMLAPFSVAPIARTGPAPGRPPSQQSQQTRSGMSLNGKGKPIRR